MWWSRVLIGVVLPGLQKVPAPHLLSSQVGNPNSPERVPHKSLEQGGIARPGVKAESNKGTTIPDSVHVPNHLAPDHRQTIFTEELLDDTLNPLNPCEQ